MRAPRCSPACWIGARYLADGLRALGYRTLGGEPVRIGPAPDAPIASDRHADRPDPGR